MPSRASWRRVACMPGVLEIAHRHPAAIAGDHACSRRGQQQRQRPRPAQPRLSQRSAPPQQQPGRCAERDRHAGERQRAAERAARQRDVGREQDPERLARVAPGRPGGAAGGTDLAHASSMPGAVARSRLSVRGSAPPAPSSCSLPGHAHGLLVAAARELGDDPAGGEGHAERGQRPLADQFRRRCRSGRGPCPSAHPSARGGGAGVFGRGQAGQRAVGQFGLHSGLAQPHLVAGERRRRP